MIVLGVLLAMSVVANIALWVVVRGTLDEAHEMFGELDGCRAHNADLLRRFDAVDDAAADGSYQAEQRRAWADQQRHVRQEDTGHGAPFDDHPEWNTMRST